MNIKNIVWTVELVEEWVQIAAQVERVLPDSRPRLARSNVDFPENWLSYLWDEMEKEKPEPRFQPTNEQISMWEEVVLNWIPAIDGIKDRKILWWRACGMGWLRISKKINVERHTPKRRYEKVCEELARKLNYRE